MGIEIGLYEKAEDGCWYPTNEMHLRTFAGPVKILFEEDGTSQLEYACDIICGTDQLKSALAAFDKVLIKLKNHVLPDDHLRPYDRRLREVTEFFINACEYALAHDLMVSWS